ncbi:hypothetical protein GCM10027276_18580 [Comamonas piscis]
MSGQALQTHDGQRAQRAVGCVIELGVNWARDVVKRAAKPDGWVRCLQQPFGAVYLLLVIVGTGQDVAYRNGC